MNLEYRRILNLTIIFFLGTESIRKFERYLTSTFARGSGAVFNFDCT